MNKYNVEIMIVFRLISRGLAGIILLKVSPSLRKEKLVLLEEVNV